MRMVFCSHRRFAEVLKVLRDMPGAGLLTQTAADAFSGIIDHGAVLRLFMNRLRGADFDAGRV